MQSTVSSISCTGTLQINSLIFSYPVPIYAGFYSLISLLETPKNRILYNLLATKSRIAISSRAAVD